MAIRPLALVLTFLLPLTGVAAGQGGSGEKAKTPKNGDTIVAKGCLRGSMLEAFEIGFADGEDRTPAAHVFHLKGKKDLLKQLREGHDGREVQVTGVLKSNLSDPDRPGTRVGNTRIVIGAEPTRAGGVDTGTTQALPVLEAKSFEGSSTSCRR